MTEPVLEEPVRQYRSYVHWFDEYFAPTFARPLKTNWCNQWEHHPEVVEVINALWISWEFAIAVHEQEGMAVWIRDYAYALLLDRLQAGDGPFDGCDWKEDRHDPTCVPLGRKPLPSPQA